MRALDAQPALLLVNQLTNVFIHKFTLEGKENKVSTGLSSPSYPKGEQHRMKSISYKTILQSSQEAWKFNPLVGRGESKQ